MSFTAMKYKDFVWPHNPSRINISTKRNIKEMNIPFNGNVFQDYGREKRIISGTGEFFGSNSLEQYNSLFRIFKQHGSGTLVIPKISPFTAVFKSLKLTEDSTPNVVGYSFEFWEEVLETAKGSSTDYYHVATVGDTLWDISNKYNVAVEVLIKSNPNIKNPNVVTPGEKVSLV